MMNVLCREVFYGLAMVCHPLFLGIFFQKNKVLSAEANRHSSFFALDMNPVGTHTI
jgi:hypothetical protein